MGGYYPQYHVRTPENLGQALQILAEQPGRYTPLAGGTDLMVLADAATLRQTDLLNIWGLDELREISVTNDHVAIGALCTFSDIQRHPVLAAEFPMLCTAASLTGALAIQNRGTLGGNIVNASPAADSPPVLLVHDTTLDIISVDGTREVDYHGFHTGYKTMDLQPTELLHTIRISRRLAGGKRYYRKVGTRRAQAISKVVIAAIADVDGDNATECRVAFGSVAATCVRCPQVEAIIVNQRLSNAVIDAAVEALTRDIKPIDDVRSTADYRLRVAQNLLRQFLNQLVGR